MMIVSACLAGLGTRYDGDTRLDPRVVDLVRRGLAIPVCPEQLGGLPTPRPPLEFDSPLGGEGLLDGRARALTAGGEDCSAGLVAAAHAVLRLVRLYDIEGAIMKDGSPSCGVTYVYMAGSRIPGRGATAALLMRHGLRVTTVDTI
jgi:uncharacterized protein YbbK (DUF523 family)